MKEESGTVWITNGEIDKVIKEDLLDDFLSNGFIRGRKPRKGE